LAYCSECGSKLNVEAKLCDNCGVDLSEAAPEKTFERRQIDFGPVTNAANLLTERIPMLGNTKVQAAIATVAILLASFLYSDWRLDFGKFSDEQTSNENATGTDFSTYEDDFLSELIERRVTGPANVRNYPTSQNTNIFSKLARDAKVTGRWVRGFDPTTKWLRLERGGYIWEGNLNSPTTPLKSTKVEFPGRLLGVWSTEQCSGGDHGLFVIIEPIELAVHDTVGRLDRISQDHSGDPLYHVKLDQSGGVMEMILHFSFNASGRMLTMKHINQPDMEDWVLWDAGLDCDQRR